jgi:hypothetical protein
VELLASAQIKEETTSSLCVGTIEAPGTFRKCCPHKLKEEMGMQCGLFDMSSLKRGRNVTFTLSVDGNG